MDRLFNRAVALCFVLWFVFSCVALNAQDLKKPQRTMEETLQTIAAGETSEPPALRLLSALIEVADGDDEQRAVLAVRAIELIGPAAKPAIPVLCTQLFVAEHAARDFAVRALVAIGEESVPQLREVVKSSSGRARAAAVTALNRLNKLDFETVSELTKDKDARVRVVAAAALAGFEKPAISLLLSLLKDKEVAVAIVAAQSLQENKSDTAGTIPTLIQNLKRPGLDAFAAKTLAAYGTDAQRAIPALLDAYPIAPTDRYSWNDEVEDALNRIGPPHVDDLNRLIKLMFDDSEDKQSLVFRTVSKIGPAGRRSAPIIEAAILTTAKRYYLVQHKFADQEFAIEDNSAVISDAIGDMLQAYWNLTRDIDEFTRVSKSIAGILTDHATLIPESNCSTASLYPLPLMERMLSSPKRNLKLAALDHIQKTEEEASPLYGDILRIAQTDDKELSEAATIALLKVAPERASEITKLFEKLRISDAWKYKPFTQIVIQKNINSLEIRSHLEAGLINFNDDIALSCAGALLAVTKDPVRHATRLIKMGEEGKFHHHDVMKLLSEMRPIPRFAYEYVAKYLESTDYLEKQAAIDTVGHFGAAATDSLPILRAALNDALKDDEEIGIQAVALKSICQITGDFASFISRLRFPSDTREMYYHMKSTVGVGLQGDPLVDELQALAQSLDDSTSEAALRALQKIGTPKAIAALKALAISKDWKVRCEARLSLKEININFDMREAQ